MEMQTVRDFRAMPKEPLQVQVPSTIVTLIRRRAADERRSMASIITEMLAQGFGLDPREFGIEPQQSSLSA